MSKDYKKLYEDALKNLKQIKYANRNNNELVDFIEYNYPELKEKESEDERISKDIIWCIKHSGIKDTNAINPHVTTIVKDALDWLEKKAEQKHPNNVISKPVWSEEDNYILKNIYELVQENIINPNKSHYVKECLTWLKSIKQRVQLQSKQELNEEIVDYYVDLGLPSGTKWKSANEDGYYTYDEAVKKFGNSLPSKEQWEELKGNCIWVWKGNGYDVTGPNGKTIYLRAAGCFDGTKAYNVDMYGYY